MRIYIKLIIYNNKKNQQLDLEKLATAKRANGNKRLLFEFKRWKKNSNSINAKAHFIDGIEKKRTDDERTTLFNLLLL